MDQGIVTEFIPDCPYYCGINHVIHSGVIMGEACTAANRFLVHESVGKKSRRSSPQRWAR